MIGEKEFYGTIFDIFPPSGREVNQHSSDFKEVIIPPPQTALLSLNSLNIHSNEISIDETIEKIKKSVQEEIRANLRKQMVQASKDRTIFEICNGASQFLVPQKNPSEIDKNFKLHLAEDTVRKTPYQFQKEWIENVPYYLSSSSKNTMMVLPYLMVCFISSISTNKLDLKVSENYKKVRLPFCGENGSVLNKNFPHNMAKHFVSSKNKIPFRALLELPNPWDYYIGDKDNATCICDADCLLAIHPSEDEMEFQTFLADVKSAVRCWELFRCFAAFAFICKDIKSVNLTLSMVLFSNMFSFDRFAIALIENENPPYVTWDDIVGDNWHDKICKISEKKSDILYSKEKVGMAGGRNQEIFPILLSDSIEGEIYSMAYMTKYCFSILLGTS